MRLLSLRIGAVSLMMAASARAQDAAAPPVEPASQARANLAAGAASGDATGKFGARGQLAVSVGLPLTGEAPELGIVHASTSMGGGSSTTVALQPSADYFITPNLSVGGLIGIRYASYSEPPGGLTISGNSTVLQVEARVGYNLALGDVVSLWPRIGIGYAHASAGVLIDPRYSVPLDIFAPLLWHPTHHFFVGAGPVFTTELVDKSGGQNQPKPTNFGVQAVVGGYFGG
jgi:hypothetical protein